MARVSVMMKKKFWIIPWNVRNGELYETIASTFSEISSSPILPIDWSTIQKARDLSISIKSIHHYQMFEEAPLLLSILATPLLTGFHHGFGKIPFQIISGGSKTSNTLHLRSREV
jgi:hypothetical protein